MGDCALNRSVSCVAVYGVWKRREGGEGCPCSSLVVIWPFAPSIAVLWRGSGKAGTLDVLSS